MLNTNTTATVEGFDEIADLLVMAMSSTWSTVTRIEWGFCCDNGNWNSEEVDTDTEDVWTSLIIYRNGGDEVGMRMEYTETATGNIDTNYPIKVTITSGYGEYSSTQYRIVNTPGYLPARVVHV